MIARRIDLMKFAVEKLACYERKQEIVTMGVPFPQGEVFNPNHVAVYTKGKAVPTQSRVTATWPDRSIKWAITHFLADLPANEERDFELLTGKVPSPSFPVIVDRTDEGGLLICTGQLHVTLLPPDHIGLFHQIVHKDWKLDYPSLSEIGIVVEDRQYRVKIASPGWKVIENGPIRAVVEAKGKHCSDEGIEILDFIIRIHVFTGKPWLMMDYQVINTSDNDIDIDEMSWQVKPSTTNGQVRTALATSNYKSKIQCSKSGNSISHTIDADQLLFEANEQIPETLYGTFWADWDCSQGGVAVTLYQAHQNFPKKLSVNKSGFNAQLIPRGNKLTLASGVAKTHRMFVHFHESDYPLTDLNIRSLQFQLPDKARLPAESYHSIGLGAEAKIDRCIPAVERYLLDLADFRSRGYGILHWGDGPDNGYTSQGRGKGEPVWTNNEYDLPHAAMMMYIHTGERRMLDYLLIAARHWMDVDFCHYSSNPFRHEAHIMHSANHVTGGVSISHEWVEGLLHYYHMTGEQEALEKAIAIGENVLRHLSRPIFAKIGVSQARETGWALRTLAALYLENNDQKWLKPAKRIVEQFSYWQETYGAWLAPYTNHTLIRVPFMIAVAINSLVRYYWIRPTTEVKQMIICAAEDLITHCRQRDGRFFYKDLPSLRRSMNVPIILEALAFAYDLSRDCRFLEAGLTMFEEIVSSRSRSAKRKSIHGDTVILDYGVGPKSFAMNAPAILIFYRALNQAGFNWSNIDQKYEFDKHD